MNKINKFLCHIFGHKIICDKRVFYRIMQNSLNSEDFVDNEKIYCDRCGQYMGTLKGKNE